MLQNVCKKKGLVFYSNNIASKNIWTIDKKLSEIKFEVPVLLGKKIKGQFKEFDGFVVIDLDNKENNKALFSVQINSIEFNYMTEIVTAAFLKFKLLF